MNEDLSQLSDEELMAIANGDAQPGTQQQQAQTSPADNASEDELAAMQRENPELNAESTPIDPVKDGFRTFFGSFFGQGRKDAMADYRAQTRTGDGVDKTLGYLSDLGNSFYAGIVGGGTKLAEAAGHVFNNEKLVQGARDFQAGAEEYLPTDMVDTAEVDENGNPRERTWGQRVLGEGKNVMRMMGEFAPAAATGPIGAAVGKAYTWANIGASGVNRYNQIYDNVIANAEANHMQPSQARLLGAAGGAIDAFANAFLMGKVTKGGANPITDRFFQTFVKRMIGGAAKTGGVMGASAGAQSVIDQMAQKGDFDVEATGNAVVDGVIQGAMFHVMNDAMHAPIHWSQYKTVDAAKRLQGEREAANAEQTMTEGQVAAEAEARAREMDAARAEQRAIDAQRAVLSDPQGIAAFARNNPDLVVDLISARRRGDDAPMDGLLDTGVNGIGDLRMAFQSQKDANNFADRLIDYVDNQNAAARLREAKAQGELVEEGNTLEDRQKGWDEKAAAENEAAKAEEREARLKAADEFIGGGERQKEMYDAWLNARGLEDSPDLRMAFHAEEMGASPRSEAPAEVRGEETRQANQDAQRVENMDDANRADRLIEADGGETYRAWCAWLKTEDSEGNRLQFLRFMNGQSYAVDSVEGNVRHGRTGNGKAEAEEFNRFYDAFTGTKPMDGTSVKPDKSEPEPQRRIGVEERQSLLDGIDVDGIEYAPKGALPEPTVQSRARNAVDAWRKKTGVMGYPEYLRGKRDDASMREMYRLYLQKKVSDAAKGGDDEAKAFTAPDLKDYVQGEFDFTYDAQKEAPKPEQAKVEPQKTEQPKTVESEAKPEPAPVDAKAETPSEPAKEEVDPRVQLREKLKGDAVLKRLDAAYRKAKTDAERSAIKDKFNERVAELRDGTAQDAEKRQSEASAQKTVDEPSKDEKERKTAETKPIEESNTNPMADKGFVAWLGGTKLADKEVQQSYELYRREVARGKVDPNTGKRVEAKKPAAKKTEPKPVEPVVEEAKMPAEAKSKEKKAEPSADIKELGKKAIAAQKKLGPMSINSDADLLKSRARMEKAGKKDAVQAIDDLLAYRKATQKPYKPEGDGIRESRTAGEVAKENEDMLTRIGERLTALVPGTKVRIGDTASGNAEFDTKTGEAVIPRGKTFIDAVHEIGAHGMFRWAKANAPAHFRRMLEYVRTAPKDIRDFVYDNYRDFAEKGDYEGLVDEIFAHRFERENGEGFRRLLEDKPANRRWWTNMAHAMRRVFTDAAKRNGVDLSGLNGLDAETYMKRVAEQMALGKTLNEYTAFGEDMKYLKAIPQGAPSEGVEIDGDDGKRYSIKSATHDIDDGRMEKELVSKGVYTETEARKFIKKVGSLVDSVIKFDKQAGGAFDLHEDYDADGRGKFSPYKDNSDPLYTMSLDFSTLCKKRIITQQIIDRLQTEVKKDFLTREEQVAVRSMLKEYAKKEKALQVACHLCYVEAARLKAAEQNRKLFSSPERMRAEFVNYLAQKNKDFKAETIAAQSKWKSDHGYQPNATKDQIAAEYKRRVAAGEKNVPTKDDLNAFSRQFRTSGYKPSAAEEKLISRFIKMGRRPFLDANRVMEMSRTDPVIYDMYTTFIRNATKSKALEGNVPYYFGDSKALTKGFIQQMNEQGTGMRHQSWSDFQLTHLLDTVTALADLSTRGAKMHAYTKVGDMVRIFGDSGIMFNMSLIPDAAGGFSPVEGMAFAEAKRLRERFPATAGTIAVAKDNANLMKLLDMDEIDYIIPYHSSGMPIDIRNMAGIGKWTDYERMQNVSPNERIRKRGDAKEWRKEPSIYELVRANGKRGYAAMEDAAQEYVRLCNERGLKPKFHAVEGLFRQNADGAYELLNRNYWKTLVDHKMVNHKTGELIEQRVVRPEFSLAEANRAMAREAKGYDPGLADRAFEHVKGEYGDIEKRIAELKAEDGIREARRPANPMPAHAAPFMDAKETKLGKYRKNISDRYDPIKSLVMDVDMAGGKSKAEARASAENDAASPYHAKRVQKGLVEKDMAVIGGLRRQLEKFLKDSRSDGIDVDDFGRYIYAKHAKDRNAQKLKDHGIADGSGMSDADADAIIDGFRRSGKLAKLEAARKAFVVELNDKFGLDYLHKAGLIDQQSVDRLKSAYGKDYVPLKDDITDEDGVDYGRAASVANPLLKASGRGTEAENPTAFMLLGAMRNVTNAAENIARESMAKFVEAHPEVGEVRLVKPTDSLGDDAITFRRNEMVDVVDNGKVIGREEVNRRYVVELYGNRGKRVQRSFTDADLVRGPEWMQNTTRWFASWATQLSPTFSFRNWAKDTMEVTFDTLGTSGVGAAGRFLKGQFAMLPLWNADFRNVMREFRETGKVTGTSQIAQDFRKFVESGALIGGGGAREGYGEVTEGLRDIGKTLSRTRETGKRIGAMWEAYKDKVGVMNESIEMLTRFNNFRRRIADGESAEQAAMNAREGSTDFGMYGNQRWMNSVWMFSNSILGGTLRGAKTMAFGKYGRRLAAGMVALGMMEEMADLALNGDEQDERRNGTGTGDDVTEFERENGLRIRFGGQYVRIPIHLGPWSLLKYAGSNLARVMQGRLSAEDAVKNVAASAATVATHFTGTGEKGFGEGSPSLVNSMTPSAVQPFVQVAMNENYKGDQIYTEHTMPGSKDRPDWKYARRNTNRIAVQLSRIINNIPFTGGNDNRKGALDVPPETLEYLTKQVFKNFGTDVVNTLVEVPSRAVQSAMGDADAMELRTTPVVRDFVRKTPDVSSRYYKEMQAYEGDLREYKDMPAGGRAAFAKAHYGMHGQLKELKKRIDNAVHGERGERKSGSTWVTAPNMSESAKKLHGEMKLKLMAKFLRLREAAAAR